MKKKIAISMILMLIIALVIYTIKNPMDVANLPEDYQSRFYATFVSLLPPLVAIALALITKEVYSSLFVGIAAGAILYSNGNMELALNTVLFNAGDNGGGMLTKIAGNAGILVFLVLLGILVALMNKTGGSAAFGRWAVKHIKTRTGAQLATMLLRMPRNPVRPRRPRPRPSPVSRRTAPMTARRKWRNTSTPMGIFHPTTLQRGKRKRWGGTEDP